MKKTNLDYFCCMLLGAGYIGAVAGLFWIIWMICEAIKGAVK